MRETLSSLEHTFEMLTLFAASPDRLLLKNGAQIKCKIVAESRDSVRVATCTDIARDQVASTNHGPPGYLGKVVLKNGTEVNCEIISETPDFIRVIAYEYVPKDQVKFLIRGSTIEEQNFRKLESEQEQISRQIDLIKSLIERLEAVPAERSPAPELSSIADSQSP